MQIDFLHEFTVLVSFMSFTRASRELGISQPTLSSHIAALEREVGVPLLERDTVHMELTPAGKLFYERASQMTDFYERTLKDCRQLKTRETLVLKQPKNLDYVNHEFSLIVTEYQQICPSVTVRVIDADNILAFNEVLQGRIDLIVVSGCEGDTDFLHEYKEGIGIQPFLRRPVGIATNADNPLAGKPDLKLSDVANLVFTLPANLAYMEAELSYRSGLAANGFEPKIAHCGENDVKTYIMTLMMEDKVLFMGAEAAQYSSQMHNGFVTTPFNPPVTEVCYFAYSVNNRKTALKEFLDLVKERGVVSA